MKLTGVRIGLDLDAREMRLAAVSGGSRGWRLDSWARVPRAQPGPANPAPATAGALGPQDAARVAAALVRMGLENVPVRVGAPQAALLRGMVELPPRKSGAPLGQIAKLELARTHKQDASSIEADWWEIPAPARGGEGTPALAVGLAASTADALVESLESQGVHVAGIDARGLALRRACDVLVSGRDGLVALADLGWKESTLVLVHRGAVAYERVLEEGRASVLASEFKKKLGLDTTAPTALRLVGLRSEGSRFESLPLTREIRALLSEFVERLARELSVSLDYARHRYPAAHSTTVLCMGEQAAIPGVSERLSQLLGVECRMVTPADVAEIGRTAPGAERDPALLAALGLAIPGKGAA